MDFNVYKSIRAVPSFGGRGARSQVHYTSPCSRHLLDHAFPSAQYGRGWGWGRDPCTIAGLPQQVYAVTCLCSAFPQLPTAAEPCADTLQKWGVGGHLYYQKRLKSALPSLGGTVPRCIHTVLQRVPCRTKLPLPMVIVLVRSGCYNKIPYTG